MTRLMDGGMKGGRECEEWMPKRRRPYAFDA